MPKIKLLILDLDGTCNVPWGGPYLGNYEAIKKAHDEYGTKVVFATGRTFYSKRNEFEKLGDISKGNYFLASFNGAYIGDLSKDTLIEKNLIPSELAKWLWNYIETENRFAAISYDSNSYDVISSKDRELADRPNNFFHPSFKVTISTDVKEFTSSYKFVIKHFKARDKEMLESKGFHVQWEPTQNTAEINIKDINKGYVVDFFCKKLNIKHSEVLAMGDGANDVESLRKAGYGICPANAGPAAKAAASKVSKYTDEESCVAKTIEELIFINK